MQVYSDTYRKKQAQLIRARQLEGQLVALDDYAAEQFPLPVVNGLAQVGKYGGYETASGAFKQLAGAPAWEIPAGCLPEVPLVPLRLASVQVLSTGLRVTLQDGDQFTLDEVWTADQHAYDLLTKVNQRLAGDPALGAVAWELLWEEADFERRPRLLRLMNDHVSVVCASAAWDPDGKQLVAATLVAPEQQSLRAITATLATNSKKGLTLTVAGLSHYLNNARRGFTAVAGGLAQAGAEGYVLTLRHPLAGNPQEQTADHFYVLVTQGQTLATVFSERLALAIPWPTKPEWAEYLLTAGQEQELLRHLETSGPDFPAALWVQKDASGWQAVLETGLAQGQLRL
jgi:hypothetical protein